MRQRAKKGKCTYFLSNLFPFLVQRIFFSIFFDLDREEEIKEKEYLVDVSYLIHWNGSKILGKETSEQNEMMMLV